MLEEIHKPQPTTLRGDHNNLINCTFKYVDGTGLLFSGDRGRIENCLFSQIDYSCVGSLHDCMVNVRDTTHLVFRQNTLDTGGNSVGIKGGFGKTVYSNLTALQTKVYYNTMAPLYKRITTEPMERSCKKTGFMII